MFEIQVEEIDDQVPVTIMRITGELDATNFQDVIDQTRDLYAAGTRKLLLDVEKLTFMSSSGLVALHSMAMIMRGKDRQAGDENQANGMSFGPDQDREIQYEAHFKLMKPKPRIAQILTLSGFHKFIQVFTDQDTALAAF